MLYRNIVISLLLSAITLVSFSQQGEQYTRLLGEVSRFGQAEVSFEYPGYRELGDIARLVPVSKVADGMVYCVLSSADIPAFMTLGLTYKLIERDDDKAVESASSVEEAMNWDLYPTYPQYDTIVHKLAADYPSLCRVDTIGESIEGRLILALKISDNVSQDEDEPEVFYTSNMHGDELQGFVLMLRFAEHLLQNAANEGLEQTLVDSLEIWINPLSNPDGTYNFGDTISYPTRANDNGTDLNRNFPDPLDPGIVPDVENRAMINFMRSRNFVLSANFHSGYEVLNFPWDRWLSRIHADSLWFYNICRKYADTVHNHSVAAYMDSYNDGVVRGAVWYRVVGGRQDYVTYELQGREVTIELDDTKETPAAQLPLLWDYNYRSLLGFLENACYGIHGRVVDDITGEPVKAGIFISGHDRDSSHVYSDSLTGKFVRMLSPGTYDLRVSAAGYDTGIVSGLTIEDARQSNIIIRLAGASSVNELSAENRLKLWPVPAGDHLFIGTFNFIGERINIRIYSQSGIKLIELSDIMVVNDKMQIDISQLPAGYYLLSLSDSSGNSHSGRFIRQ